jgi:hypothetical protein
MKTFRRAVEANDLAEVTRLLAPDVTFNSPVSFKPFTGRDQVGFILSTVATVFQGFEYVDEVETGLHSVLRFRARVGDRDVEGVDILERNAEGLVTTLTVMVRPLSGLQALADAMRARLTADQ